EQLKIQKWNFLKKIPIKTIIDVGANEGQFVEEILNIFPLAEIYSFEPLGDCYEKLMSNFRNNKKVHTYNFALGEQDGEITFSRSSASPSSSILKMGDLHKKLYPHTANLVEEKVKIKRLDDVFADVNLENEVLLKIDVQGAEEKVIKGGSSVLKKANMIITEVSYATLYENQPLFRDIMNLLEKYGFSYIGNMEQFANPLTGAPLFADAIFVKKEIYNILYTS
ncbi:MAG TPA: FkbM family methyltransferase, partial [Ginsengibacter sp.]|nr:FkbM family methyltransferase [Ginsengibacter sp.]